jgi:hypothetical protein
MAQNIRSDEIQNEKNKSNSFKIFKNRNEIKTKRIKNSLRIERNRNETNKNIIF